MKKIRLISIFMKNQIQNKNYILLDTINMISRCMILFLLYGYVFKINNNNINGIDYKTALWSMFIYFSFLTLNIRHLYKLIMDDVKSGVVEVYLNKPINYLILNFYKIIGQGLYSFIVISLIGCIIMFIFVGGISLDMKIFIPSFIVTFLLGIILSLLIYGIIGLLSFYIQDVKPIYWVVDKFIMLFGGSYLPVALFPKSLQLLAYYSPFGAINFITSTVYSDWNYIYMNKILLQLGWGVIFIIVIVVLYRKVRNNTLINGG